MSRGRFVAALVFAGLSTAGLLVAAPNGKPGPTAEETAARDAIRAMVRSAAGATSRPADPDSGAAQSAVDRWLAANGDSIRGVAPGPLKDLPWGVCTERPAAGDAPVRLYLHVFDWHASGSVI